MYFALVYNGSKTTWLTFIKISRFSGLNDLSNDFIERRQALDWLIVWECVTCSMVRYSIQIPYNDQQVRTWDSANTKKTHMIGKAIHHHRLRCWAYISFVYSIYHYRNWVDTHTTFIKWSTCLFSKAEFKEYISPQQICCLGPVLKIHHFQLLSCEHHSFQWFNGNE